MRPERELIDLIREIISRDPEELLEPGRDDASARRLVDGIYVFNTDMVAEATDLLPGMSLRQLARKCVVSNFSDLAAKGARPLFFMASAGLSRDMSDEEFISVVKGLEEGSREFGAYFVGGDLGESRELVIAGFAVGKIESNLVKRSGAKPGDVLFTTGWFGLTWLAFQHLLGGMDLPSDVRVEALKAAYEPIARIQEGIAASAYASSSVDSSDGLYWSLEELSRASGFGFLVERIPLHPMVEMLASKGRIDPVEVAFHGGEEYEIVFSVPQDRVYSLEEEFSKEGLSLIRIGRVVEDRGVFVRLDGKVEEVEEGGWEHFKSRA